MPTMGQHEQTFPVPRFDSRAAWEARAAALRRHVLVCAGLWPPPDRPPVTPVVTGRVERDGYTVENVWFESLPGHPVAGNLYRPRGRAGRCPAVLTPHGHWDGGRLYHDAACSVPTLCANLARQGFVAFSHDMLGYGDSTAIDHEFGGWHEELWAINPLGVQLWNSLRCVDLLCSLPDVDPARIGCTGASGGGTQTFLLAAVDDRVKAAAPVCMVSAHMQGGCQCENAPNLRLDTNNVELCALAAPRPLLLVGATGDWTRNTPTVEFPAIRAIYRLFGAEVKVANVHVDAGHNFNRQSREAVYHFFGHWLRGEPEAEAPRERPLMTAPGDELRVFAGGQRPSQAGAARLTRQLERQARAALDRQWPVAPDDLDRFRAAYGPALRHALNATWWDDVPADTLGTERRNGDIVDQLRLRPTGGEPLVVAWSRPAGWDGSGAVVLVAAGGRGAPLAVGIAGALLDGLLERGWAVLSLDLSLRASPETWSDVDDPDRPVPFFTTYNRTEVARRVQDVVSALAYVAGRVPAARPGLVGDGEAGLWCLLARAVVPAPPTTVADAAEFDPAADTAYRERAFVPGLRRAGDFRTALALAAPAPVLIHNAARRFVAANVPELYAALGAPDALAVRDDALDPATIVGWLAARWACRGRVR